MNDITRAEEFRVEHTLYTNAKEYQAKNHTSKNQETKILN